MYSKITGTGGYLPERVMPNAELEALVDTSDEWIQSRTGIRQRHIAREDETTCDMAYAAALKAIQAAAIDKDEIDLIVFATSTPDQIYPSTACLLQNRLGIKNRCAAFDIQAVCSGFVYALSVADKFIKSGSANCVLVVGADCNSKILDWSDRTTCVLFGDGAGAAILRAADDPGIYHSEIHADGSYAEMLQVPGGVCHPNAEPYVRMRGGEVFKFAVIAMEEIVDDVLASVNMKKEDIDWLVPHQANQRIIAATARKLDLPMSRVMMTVQEHGNTSAASIPLALDIGIRSGRIKPGELLLLEAVGGGFTWGAVLVRY